MMLFGGRLVQKMMTKWGINAQRTEARIERGIARESSL
jgi:hypothetical protein